MLKKSIFLVIICLFLGAGLSNLSAQSETEWSTGGFYTYVVCDGVYLGYIYGTMDFHSVTHYKDGEWNFTVYQAKGEAEASFSDEKFSYKEKGRIFAKDEGVEYYVLHLKGDQGSRYMMHISVDEFGWWTFQKANCH